MASKVIKNSFNAGELSPLLDGREDLAKYFNGCRTMSNVFPLPSGGFEARPGSEFIAKAKGKSKLFEFEFSADDTMIIEAGNLYMRFYKDDDRVMTDSASVSAITLTGSSVVAVTTAAAHGFSTGDIVRFTGIVGTTELNYIGLNTEWTITVTAPTTFTIDDTDSSDFTAYVSAGTVAAIYEITTPYDADEVFELSIARSGDVFRIDHEDFWPRVLTRAADNSWTIAEITFDGGPFLSENTTTAKLMGFARTGGTARSGYYFPAGATGTLTASGSGNAPFMSSHVGARWLLKHTRTDSSTTVTRAGADTNSSDVYIKGAFSVAVTTVTAGAKIILQRHTGDSVYQDVYTYYVATDYSSEEEDGAYYRIRIETQNATATLTARDQINYGVVEVDTYVSTTVVAVTVLDPVLSDNASDNAVTTYMWAEGAWSTYRGFPRAVTFHQDRVWHGGTTYSPQTAWGTKVGVYDDYTPGGVADDDPVTVSINDDDVSEIEWLKSHTGLIAGTANKEYVISAVDLRDPMTPSDRIATVQSSNGSKHLQPVILRDAVFYAQRQGRRILMMRLNEYGDRFKSVDTTILADHLFKLDPVDMAVQRTPDPMLWVVRADGTMCVFLYNPEEDIQGWCRVVTGSELDEPTDPYVSVAVVRGSEEDSVWVEVNRTIDSTSVYYVEKCAKRYIDQLDEAMMMDSAKIEAGTYDSQDINCASDTVRYDEGLYGSGPYGGAL